MVLSGTAKQVKQQLNTMIAYYGSQELMSNIIANENKARGVKNEQ